MFHLIMARISQCIVCWGQLVGYYDDLANIFVFSVVFGLVLVISLFQLRVHKRQILITYRYMLSNFDINVFNALIVEN